GMLEEGHLSENIVLPNRPDRGLFAVGAVFDDRCFTCDENVELLHGLPFVDDAVAGPSLYNMAQRVEQIDFLVRQFRKDRQLVHELSDTHASSFLLRFRPSPSQGRKESAKRVAKY